MSSHYIINGTVGTHTSAILRTMRHVLLLRQSYLLGKHARVLYTMVLVRLFLGFVGAQDTSLCLLLPQNIYGLVAVRKRGCSIRGNILDLG